MYLLDGGDLDRTFKRHLDLIEVLAVTTLSDASFGAVEHGLKFWYLGSNVAIFIVPLVDLSSTEPVVEVSTDLLELRVVEGGRRVPAIVASLFEICSLGGSDCWVDGWRL